MKLSRIVWCVVIPMLAAALAAESAHSQEPARPADSDRRRENLSLNEVRAKVDALYVENVAWRKIAWKTCLLDGIEASREQEKPMILWIFIDRPIDDERC